MASLFTEIIYRPILNLTALVYNTAGFGDLGVAIIIITIGIRLALGPLSLKAARSQKTLSELTPEVDKIKAKHPGDTNAQSHAIIALYKEKGINPLAGCLPLLLQLPVLFGIYRVFLNIYKKESLDLLYSFVPHPTTINTMFLGLLDISKPNPVFAIVAGAAQFIQAKLTAANQPATGQAAALNKQMMYMFPVIIAVISWRLPAGLAMYWIITTVYSIGEQLYLRRR
jgi:YidC/Oxa1 family membrane protein insertase